MFATTVYNNLTYGLLPKPSMSIVEEACKKANVWEFVQQMPEKLNTFCGASTASHMSGGQKQRLAIARALLRDAQVNVLCPPQWHRARRNSHLAQKVNDSTVSVDRKRLLNIERYFLFENRMRAFFKPIYFFAMLIFFFVDIC